MKMYYSNMDSKFKWPYEDKLGILQSYYGISIISNISFCDSYFLDSGAFSAWSKSKIIDLSMYCDFIYKNIDRLDVYAALDVIGNEEVTKNNYLQMIERDLRPLPCFHITDSVELLELYLDYSDYIALGGIAKKSKKVRLKWLDKIFSSYPQIRFHGFGIQDRDILSRYPWFSVDSSSWHIMARFGGICTPYGDYKIGNGVNYKEINWKSNPFDLKEVENWVESLGISFKESCESSIRGCYCRQLINLLFYELNDWDKQGKKFISCKGFFN